MTEEPKYEQPSLFDDIPEGTNSTNLFVQTATMAAKAAADPAQAEAVADNKPKKPSRIEDFGEKIGGARKDVYAAYRDMMQLAAEAEVTAVPLSKSWPAPNYAKLLDSGIEPWRVHAVRALREALLPKPSPRHFAVGKWATYMTIFREWITPASVIVLAGKPGIPSVSTVGRDMRNISSGASWARLGWK